MSAEVFIDTNIFIYLFDETATAKRQCAESLVRQSLEDGTGCISYQVVQETMNVVVRKLGAKPDDARQLLDDVLIPLWQVNPTPSLYRRGLLIQTRYGLSFYDALIVAAALEAGCNRLYMQHGQQIQQLTIQNPFVQR